MYIRKLVKSDYASFLKLIQQFRPTIFVQEQFDEIFDKLMGDVWVCEVDGELIATGTILYEHKFIHNGGISAHIEDIFVQESYRKSGIGGSLIKHLIDEANSHHCYKIILDCKHELMPFYERLGFQPHGYQMALYQ